MRTTLIDFIVLLIAVLLINQMAFGSQPQPQSNRLIGHGISEGAVGFGKAFALARDAGLEFIELSLAWDDHRSQIRHMNFMWLHDVPDSKLKEFEFNLNDFSVDDKTRQDGILDPSKISSLILADPAAVHNKKQGIRTVWLSNLIFK